MKTNLETLRHSAAHVLAQAVKRLYPNIKLAIGPSIDDGFYYDFDKPEPFTPEDLKKLEKEMQKIIDSDFKFERSVMSVKDAEKQLKDEPYKLELLHDLKEDPSFYKDGEFMDLCRGPHVESTKDVRAFKLLKMAGAYWRGDSSKRQLQRIYGTAFGSSKELKDYLTMIEEAEKRDHRKLGKQLELFSIHEEGPGFIFWHPKGMALRNILLDFWRKEHTKEGYVEIQTPIMMNKSLWERSGHWGYYRENMYVTNIDNEEFVIKPMNCPGGILYYEEKLHSYREFPLRVGEIGTVHRHELSGVLSGLFRVRCFTQDDAHIFMTPEQITGEIVRLIDFIDRFYKLFGFEYEVELSTMPEQHIGSDEMWNMSTDGLRSAMDKKEMKYQINDGDGAFYGPKIDFKIRDCIGRMWQCGTIQLDMNLPERFEMEYDGADGKRHRPVMVHRVIYGSLERFIGVLIEHYAGKFPLWLSPTQVKILTMNEKNDAFALKLKSELEASGIRVDIDVRNETIGRKVRDAQMEKSNYIVTVGDKEVENNVLAVRDRDGKVTFGVKVKDFVADILDKVEKKL